jgi:hypothetical protein
VAWGVLVCADMPHLHRINFETAMLSQTHVRYNPMARPTKYNQEMLEKAQHYLDHYEEYDDIIPSAVGLALVLDITRSTLYAWARDDNKKVFSHILDNINKKQEQVLLKKGLNNEFNSNITKLVLVGRAVNSVTISLRAQRRPKYGWLASST